MKQYNNIESFIRDHRNAFDGAAPDVHGWAGLTKMLGRLQGANQLEQHLMLNRILFDTATPSENLWGRIEQELEQSAFSSTPQTADSFLEAFIRSHRSDFDSVTPDLRVWASIEQAVPAKAEAKVVRVHWSRNLMRAAAALVLLLTGIGIGTWYARTNVSGSGMAMGDVNREYAELEQYYQRDIAVKQQKLVNLTGDRDDDVQEDLAQMDKVMEELRLELADVPAGNREQVVRAMIENYKAKAAILQRVLEHLEPTQSESTNSSKHAIENI